MGEIMVNKIKFKVLERTDEDCIHDTGVIHSTCLSCINVERMVTAYAMREDHPDHDRIWHDEKNNPDLICLEV